MHTMIVMTKSIGSKSVLGVTYDCNRHFKHENQDRSKRSSLSCGGKSIKCHATGRRNVVAGETNESKMDKNSKLQMAEMRLARLW